MTMTSIHSWLDEYGESHRHPINKTIHWICVPLIYWAVIALLWSVPVPAFMAQAGFPLNWAIVVFALVQAYYFALSPKLGLGLLVVNIALLRLTWWVNLNLVIPLWQIAVAVFVAAWIGQFIGHHVEGKKPSFFKDLQFLLIGPAWLMGHTYRKLGIAF